jgi:hypothetical protein
MIRLQNDGTAGIIRRYPASEKLISCFIGLHPPEIIVVFIS